MQPVGARRTFLKTGAILALVVGAVFGLLGPAVGAAVTRRVR